MQIPPNPLTLQRRIEFSQTDAAGLIHFTTYFTLMETAEAALFRQLNLPLIWTEDAISYGYPRVDCQCKFRKPLHFDSLVTIELTLQHLDSRRLQYACRFLNEAGQCCASGNMTTAFVQRDGTGKLKGIDIGENARKRLENWKNQDSGTPSLAI